LINYYGQNLHAYRTEKFVGWQNQPANGVPLFGNGSFGYNVVQDAAKATPSPTASPPAAATGGASVAPVDSGAPAATLPASNNTSSGGSAVPLVLGVVVLIVVLAIAGVALRSRRAAVDEDE
jgi:hypothetical protein